MTRMSGTGFQLCIAASNHSPKSEGFRISLLLRTSMSLPLALESLVDRLKEHCTHSVVIIVQRLLDVSAALP